MSSKKSNCERVRTSVKNKRVTVNYSRPVFITDLKREGRFLRISTPNVSLKLNGSEINALKRALEEAGEVECLDWQSDLYERV